MGTKNHPGEFDCYEAADPDEPMFILLGRDEDGPERVDEWARKRFETVAKRLAAIQLPDRYNAINKAWLTKQLRKIAEALQCANNMRDWKRREKSKDALLGPGRFIRLLSDDGSQRVLIERVDERRAADGYPPRHLHAPEMTTNFGNHTPYGA